MNKKSKKHNQQYRKGRQSKTNKENLKSKAVSNEKAKPKPYLFFIFFGFFILLLPVIHSTETLDQVMMPRLFAVNLFLMLFTVLFFYSAKFFNESSSVLRNIIFPLFGIWFIISIISLFFSTNPIEGLYDIIKTFNTLAVLAMAAMILYKTESWEDKITLLVSVAAIIVSLIGFVQYYQKVYLSTSPVIEDDPYLRPVIYLVDGLMAHKNLFSLSLFLSLPFIMWGMFSQKRILIILSIVSFIMIMVLIVLLQTRAVWLGFMAAAAFTVLVLLLFRKKFELPRMWRIAIFSAIIAGVLGISGVLYLSATGSQNPYIQQFRSIIDPEGPQNIHRINIWKSTSSMISDKPFTGFGPGNWKLHAGYYFEGRFFDENQLNWMRPHNDFLWVFAEKGIFGLLAYLLLFALCYYYLFRTIISDTTKKQKLLALFLIFGFTGYLVASNFDFPYERIYHQMFIGIMMACSVVLYQSAGKKDNMPLAINRFIPMFILFLCFGFGTIYGNKAVKQEKELKIAREHIRRESWHGVLRHSKNAVNPLKNLDPQANPVTSYIGLAYVNIGDMENGMTYYLDAVNLHPGSINVLNNLGAALFRNQEFKKAKYYLENSVSIFPSSDGVTNLSAVYFSLDDYKSAIDVIKLIPLEGRTENMQNNLFAAYYKMEDFDNAAEAILQWPASDRTEVMWRNLFAIYFDSERYDAVINIIKEVPEDERSMYVWQNLALAYYRMQDYMNAVRVITGFPEEERTEIMNSILNAIERDV